MSKNYKWRITLATNAEAAIEKIQGIDLDMVAIDRELSEDETVLLKTMLSLQQPDTRVAHADFSDTNALVSTLNDIADNFDAEEGRSYTFTDNVFNRNGCETQDKTFFRRLLYTIALCALFLTLSQCTQRSKAIPLQQNSTTLPNIKNNNKMKTKKIEFIMPPHETHWVGDGFKVHNFIPSAPGAEMKDMDPFILLDYNAAMTVPPSKTPLGVGVHPHRGFETVTIAYKGKVEHHDSSGGGGVIGTGDVQWMTAAGGVLHKEYHEKEFSEKGGEFQMVQLWTNLPARDKMNAPQYQAIENAQMGRAELPDNAGFVEVISGEYNGVKGPATTHSPIALMNAKLNKGGKADFSFPAHYNTALLVIEGSVKVNGENAPLDNFVKFANEGETFTVEATSDNTITLILSGEPLNEPIASYGPFVMNTKEQIMQAFEDYNQGKFGYLED